MEENIKQIIILRKDLNMRKGKMVAQGAHASMGAILSIAKKIIIVMKFHSQIKKEKKLTWVSG